MITRSDRLPDLPPGRAFVSRPKRIFETEGAALGNVRATLPELRETKLVAAHTEGAWRWAVGERGHDS